MAAPNRGILNCCTAQFAERIAAVAGEKGTPRSGTHLQRTPPAGWRVWAATNCVVTQSLELTVVAQVLASGEPETVRKT